MKINQQSASEDPALDPGVITAIRELVCAMRDFARAIRDRGIALRELAEIRRSVQSGLK
jgi:hypothetical protein